MKDSSASSYKRKWNQIKLLLLSSLSFNKYYGLEQIKYQWPMNKTQLPSHTHPASYCSHQTQTYKFFFTHRTARRMIYNLMSVYRWLTQELKWIIYSLCCFIAHRQREQIPTVSHWSIHCPSFRWVSADRHKGKTEGPVAPIGLHMNMRLSWSHKTLPTTQIVINNIEGNTLGDWEQRSIHFYIYKISCVSIYSEVHIRTLFTQTHHGCSVRLLKSRG